MGQSKEDILKKAILHSPQIMLIAWNIFRGDWSAVASKTIDIIQEETGLNKQDAEILKDIASIMLALFKNKKSYCLNKKYYCTYDGIKTGVCFINKVQRTKWSIADVYDCPYRKEKRSSKKKKVVENKKTKPKFKRAKMGGSKNGN